MNQAPGGGSTLASRWRTIYDVMLGVALFLSLLFPAAKQASTGTLEGLRNAMMLLLLDVVALVMLSRFITGPERQEARRRSVRAVRPEPAPEAVLSPGEVAALLDDSGAPREVPRLSFTESGVVIGQGADATLYANLAWSDCVAIVFTRIAVPDGPTFAYLQFVALHEERIRRGTRNKNARELSRHLGLTETAASMVWVAPMHLVHLPPMLLTYVQRNHPHVRIVRPDVVEDDD
jgi:hypothetical protein